MNFNKSVLVLAMFLVTIIACVCTDTSSVPNEPNNTPTQEPDITTSQSPPTPAYQDTEWMTTSSDALNISNAANKLATVLGDSGDPVLIADLTLYINTETNTSSYNSAHYDISDELEPAREKFFETMNSYGAFAKRIDMSIEHINAGNIAEAEVTTKRAAESLIRGNEHYAEYKEMIEDFKKKH